jgi:hypothetical protein
VGGIGIQIAGSTMPFLANLLGGAALPPVLWLLVSGAALLAWGLAETIARLVWRDPATVVRG